MAHKKSEDEMYCDIKKQAVSVTDTACDKFKYDILKRHITHTISKINNNCTVVSLIAESFPKQPPTAQTQYPSR